MKKSVTMLLVILLIGSSSDGWAQALKKGMSLKAQLGFPSAAFNWNEDIEVDYMYGISYGLQVGNQWYLLKGESAGLGLMINWLDVTYASKKGTSADGDFKRRSVDLAVLEVGPLGTYAITDQLALDVYYNLRPTGLVSGYTVDDEDEEGYSGAGVTHAVGGGFRYNLLSVGVEYVFGNTKINWDSADPKLFPDDTKIKADCFRIVAGIKF